MNKRDFYTSVLLLLLSGATTILILRSPSVQESSGPGPFFFPAVATIIMAGLSLTLLIQSLKISPKNEIALPGKRMWNRLIWIIGWCFIYAITIEKLGYLISTGLVTFALLGYFNRKQWLLNIIFSVGTPISIYFLFNTLLKVPMPKGWLGF